MLVLGQLCARYLLRRRRGILVAVACTCYVLRAFVSLAFLSCVSFTIP